MITVGGGLREGGLYVCITTRDGKKLLVVVGKQEALVYGAEKK